MAADRLMYLNGEFEAYSEYYISSKNDKRSKQTLKNNGN